MAEEDATKIGSTRGAMKFMRHSRLIIPDARGHGSSTNPQRTITHRHCAHDALARLHHLGIERCKAIGLSMGGNILLHVATLEPDRIEAMVVVSAAMYFPEQTRAIMRQVAVNDHPASEWETMRNRHRLGDDQIVQLWEWQRGMADSYDDMNFTPPWLGRIRARALIVYGDRDFLYPVEMALEMYRAIPRSELWVVPERWTWTGVPRRRAAVRADGDGVLSQIGEMYPKFGFMR